MDDSDPKLIVVAGPNGSGKSTFTAAGLVGDVQVIDPDAIAREINPDDPSAAAVAAGREALSRRNEALSEGASFAIETTMSGRATFGLMERASDAGYEVELHYVRVGTPEANIDRIEQRVATGGHHVPSDDVERRYERSLNNLPEAISLSDQATLYDNSGSEPVRVAELSRESFSFNDQTPRWAAQAAYEGAKHFLEQADTEADQKQAVMRQAEATHAAGAMTTGELDELKETLSEKANDIQQKPDLDDGYGL